MNVRDAYFSEIYNMTKDGADIVVVSADLGAPSLDDFRRDFPHRFVNVGIAEQNLLAVAGGIALTGKYVVAYGLNPFPITRAFDQMRNLMGYMEIPMTVAALNAGSCSAECGYTHMPIEDMAMVRTLSPNVQIVNPSDEEISKQIARRLISEKKPVFLRFDKYIHGMTYEKHEIDFSKGFYSTGENGGIVIVSNGIFIPKIKEMLDFWLKNNMKIKVIDCFSLPINEGAFLAEIVDSKLIVTIEDNMLIGGIGSMVLEILSDHSIVKPVKRWGLKFNKEIKDKFLNRDFWYEKIGLKQEQLHRELELLYKNL